MTLGSNPSMISSNPGPSSAAFGTEKVPYEPLKMMRAIHVENFGGPEVLQLKSNLIVRKQYFALISKMISLFPGVEISIRVGMKWQ